MTFLIKNLKSKTAGCKVETAVDSKLIEAITYDEDSRHLRVYLTNGQRREYEGVPKGVVVGLTMAESPGNFYMKAIRGKYPPRP
ncbi:KTSC domain-containing protein [Rhizobium sp. K102]|uniref:KTSC domain-containing protein n=1 Tax=Rhizobium sp. K102 TaxID=2918527 RepID=UPI001EFBE1B6|nr:KTSC domain-containing protein [Rhizobium sp. K102]ULR45006.1 KTSC domain-containing protein [Rhizobium sp. K102]